MNRGVLQSPSWWSHANTTMRLPTSHHHHHQESANTSSAPFLLAPLPPLTPYLPHNLFPHLTPPPSSPSLPFSSSSWINDAQQHLPPDSWSQLLMGGLVDGDKSGLTSMENTAKKLENWEGQILGHGLNGPNTFDTKQENIINSASSCYVYGGGIENAEFGAKPNYNSNNNNWSQSSPSKSCITTLSCNNATMLDSCNKNIVVSQSRHPPPDHSSECNSTATTGGAPKKPRGQPSSGSQSTFKLRREKLGDRITALHQLVSPFGKTDTASVLLEAIGYIRFLQSQIEALSLPYLGTATPETKSHHHESAVSSKEEESKKDLKSRGLCLVPISCTLQVGNNNGADYWAPAAFGGGFR